MINLSSLSALIRSLRHTSGIDAPALPLARVATIAPVAEDDAGAMTGSAVRASPWNRAAMAGSGDSTGERIAAVGGGSARVAGGPATRAAAANANFVEHAPSAALDLTQGARLLQAALRGSGLRAPTPPSITSDAPLVSSAGAAPPDVAKGLANAIAGSGLFYESHLARALQRDYPAAALSREPQSAWPAQAPAMDGASAASSAVPEAASAMLTRQLDVLETRSLVWTGVLWPGQRASVSFAEEAPPQRDAANDADVAKPAPTWKLTLAIDLPTLGRVRATLDLAADVVHVALAAGDGETQRRLAAARGDLATFLADARLPLGRFDVRSDDER